MIGLITLTVFVVTTVIAVLVSGLEWGETRRILAMTKESIEKSVRRHVIRLRMAKMIEHEAKLRIFLQMEFFAVAILASLNPVKPAVSGYVLASRLILISMPAILMLKALMNRADRMALVDAAQSQGAYDDELQSSYLAALWESLPILVVDTETGIIAHASPSADELFKYPAGSLVNISVDRLVPDHLRAAHKNHRAGYALKPTARPMGQTMKLVGRCMDGSEVPVSIQLVPILGNSRILAILMTVGPA